MEFFVKTSSLKIRQWFATEKQIFSQTRNFALKIFLILKKLIKLQLVNLGNLLHFMTYKNCKLKMLFICADKKEERKLKLIKSKKQRIMNWRKLVIAKSYIYIEKP